MSDDGSKRHGEDAGLGGLLSPEGPATAEEQAELSELWKDLSPRVEAQERTVLGRLRALSTTTRLALAALMALLAVLASLLLTPRPELSAYPPARMALVLCGCGVLLALALRTGLRPVHRPSPSVQASVALALSAVLSALLFALLPEAHHLLPHTAPLPHETVWDRARPCLLFGLGTGLPVFLLLRALDRGARYAPWLAAVALGLTGNLALQLHCPLTNSDHLVAGHVMVLVVALLAVGIWTALRGRAQA
ncbi:MAG: hypothetical protein OXT09_36890 [Myxococcales bacterium]|nr:hypothetical protein [Myxococcales bacterium]